MYDNIYILNDIEFENQMRIDGTYEEWKEDKIKADKLAWIKDQKQQIKELKEQKTPDFYNQVAADGQTLDKEKWGMNMEKITEKANEYLEYLNKEEESLK